MLTREDVESVLHDDGYLATFESVVRTALQDWRDVITASPDKMRGANQRERAVFLNRRVVELVCEALEDDPNVDRHDIEQTTIITINDEITIRFKMLDQNLRPMNTITHRVDSLWRHNMQLLPRG